MPSLKMPSIDLAAVGRQFEGLQGRHPGLWPTLPRALLLVAVFLVVQVLAAVMFWSTQLADLKSGEERELVLKQQYSEKLSNAINLDVLRGQKQQVALYVAQLEKQLPSRAEMDALLSDITQAGHARGLDFELFKPGQPAAREFYAELPIGIRMTGGFHELAGFASDIANLARIVTLNNINVTSSERSTTLTMDAVVKTYRYLDPDEVSSVAKAKAKAGGGK
jgi:type IV pilus assembly protein PilO